MTYALICEVEPDPLTLECATGWQVVEPISAFIPYLSLEDSVTLATQISLLWCGAWIWKQLRAAA